MESAARFDIAIGGLRTRRFMVAGNGTADHCNFSVHSREGSRLSNEQRSPLAGASPSNRSTIRWVWPAVKWTLCLLVTAFVARRGLELWRAGAGQPMRWQPGWTAAAVLAYLAGWLPSVWYWRRLLRSHGYETGWRQAICAYYVGHLGKYIPGKMMVLVLRAGWLSPHCPKEISVVTALYETLGFMGVGAALAVALAPVAAGESVWRQLPAGWRVLRDQAWILPVASALLVAGSLPLITAAMGWIARKLMKLGSADRSLPPLAARDIAWGLAVLVLGWVGLAVSLGCTLASLRSETQLSDFPIWLAATTSSTVGGFVVLIAPGGLGVREGILIELLKDAAGPSAAVGGAVMLRIVWFVAELIAAGLCTLWAWRHTDRAGR